MSAAVKTPLTEAQQNQVLAHLPLVRIAMRPYLCRQMPAQELEDLQSHLTLALCVYSRKWVPEKGTPSTYILKCLAGSAKNYFRDYAWTIRPPKEIRTQRYSQLLHEDDGEQRLREQGEDPIKIHSALLPASLDKYTLNADFDGAEASGIIDDALLSDEDIEELVVANVGGSQIVGQLFTALAPEEQAILTFQMDRPEAVIGEIQDLFGISQAAAKRALEETLAKARVYYALIDEDEPLPPSQGCTSLIEELRRHFVPAAQGFAARRRELQGIGTPNHE